MIKKNHSKNCDISDLCIELVVKEMSQWDVSSRRGSALLKERLPSCWRCNMPAIWTLQANMKSQKHTAIQRGATLSETPEVFGLLIKIHYYRLQSLFQEAASCSGLAATHWQPTSRWQAHSLRRKSTILSHTHTRTKRPFLSLCSRGSFHSLPRTAGLAASI